eukprot:scaffold140362_cov26-Tisochrysis_lutea.AAC.1
MFVFTIAIAQSPSHPSQRQRPPLRPPLGRGGSSPPAEWEWGVGGWRRVGVRQERGSGGAEAEGAAAQARLGLGEASRTSTK